MSWMEFQSPTIPGVYHLARRWQSNISGEHRYDAACQLKLVETRTVDGRRYCLACARIFRGLMDSIE